MDLVSVPAKTVSATAKAGSDDTPSSRAGVRRLRLAMIGPFCHKAGSFRRRQLGKLIAPPDAISKVFEPGIGPIERLAARAYRCRG